MDILSQYLSTRVCYVLKHEHDGLADSSEIDYVRSSSTLRASFFAVFVASALHIPALSGTRRKWKSMKARARRVRVRL